MANGETQNVLIPAIMTCVKDKNVMIKLAAERAALHVLQIKNGTPSAVRFNVMVFLRGFHRFLKRFHWV